MIDETHVGPEYFPDEWNELREWTKRTQAFWSVAPTKSRVLLLFVHGWSGNAITTWEEFLSLSPPEWFEHDFVCYGYNSLQCQAKSQADELLYFFRTFLPNPSHWINKSMSHLFERFSQYARPEFQYARIVIIAHSLGAVIARRACLEARSLSPSQNAWLPLTRLACFAPAHNGSWLPRLGNIVPAVVAGISLAAVPSIVSLGEKSQTIMNLNKEVREILSTPQHCPPLKASAIVFGTRENIVIDEKFPGDPRSHDPPYPYVNHVNVCKPKPDWEDPIDLVQAVITGP